MSNSNRIKINCKYVYETGLKYDEILNNILEDQQKLSDILDNIPTYWEGVASHNFQVSFEKHIASLDDIINTLGYNSDVLKGSALEHNGVDNDFSEKLKRSDIIDERES